MILSHHLSHQILLDLEELMQTIKNRDGKYPKLLRVFNSTGGQWQSSVE